MKQIIMCLCPAIERWLYIAMSSLIGLAHTQNDTRSRWGNNTHTKKLHRLIAAEIFQTRIYLMYSSVDNNPQQLQTKQHLIW